MWHRHEDDDSHLAASAAQAASAALSATDVDLRPPPVPLRRLGLLPQDDLRPAPSFIFYFEEIWRWQLTEVLFE